MAALAIAPGILPKQGDGFFFFSRSGPPGSGASQWTTVCHPLASVGVPPKRELYGYLDNWW